MLFGDVALVVLVASPSDADARAVRHDRVRLLGFGIALGALLVSPMRGVAFVAHEAALDERLVVTAAAVGAPSVAAAEGVDLASPLYLLRDGVLESANVDEGEPWTRARARPEVLPLRPAPAILPRRTTLAEAADALAPINGPGGTTLAMVQTTQPRAGWFATAFVAPPLRTLPGWPSDASSQGW